MIERAHEQLRLMHDELNRQLEDLTSRHSGMNARATTIITASAVVAFGQGLGHGAKWASILAVGSAGFAFLFAVGALLAHLSRGSQMSKFPIEVLEKYLAADPYSARYQVWQDGMVTLRNSQGDLRRKAVWVNFSFLSFGVGLVFSILAIATAP